MQETILKPLIEQRADPYIYKHTDGYYYFTASVPLYDQIELRRATTIEGLATAPTVTAERGSSMTMSSKPAPSVSSSAKAW